VVFFFFFQAEDGIRDLIVTGVQTCALPICLLRVELLHRCLDRACLFTIAVHFTEERQAPLKGSFRRGSREQERVAYDAATGGLRSEERRVGKECRGGRGW